MLFYDLTYVKLTHVYLIHINKVNISLVVKLQLTPKNLYMC